MTSSTTNNEIQELARSVASLPVRKNEHAALMGMYLGALHSLSRAADLGFTNRTGSISRRYRAELRVALKRLAAAKPNALSDHWLAGFYFNDALFRLAALYERSLATATGASRRNVPCLRDIAVAKGLMSTADYRTLDTIRKDVNDLKHVRDGLLKGKGRRVNHLDLAFKAAREAAELLKRTIKA